MNSDKDDLLLKDSTLQRFLGKPINAFGSRMVKITHMGIYFHGEKELVYVDDQLNFTFLCIKTHIHGMLSRKLEFQSQIFYSIQKLV